MSKIAAQVLIDRLADWGVDTVLGPTGDGINRIIEGLRRNHERTRFVVVHHEEASAFLATAHAKSTGCLGLCLAASGPGAIQLGLEPCR
jgi:pyruvate dehydrogenase (quinone)/pyruvate oxidase